MSKNHQQDESIQLTDAIYQALATKDIEAARRLSRMLHDVGDEEAADNLYKLSHEWEREEWAYDQAIGN